jgi:hypothetical protein
MNRRAQIGFDRRIDLAWLDAAALCASSGATGDELRCFLWDQLAGHVSGEKRNSARGKTVTVLNHIWGSGPSLQERLRNRALRGFETRMPEERLAIHWAMMIGSYPIFADTSSAIGRLLALQGKFSLAQLTRRLVADWGERSTLQRACQRIVRSMVQWGVLRDSVQIGVYEASAKRIGITSEVGMLVMEALLMDAEASTVALDQLVTHPAIFPFKLAVSSSHLRAAPQFRVHRMGLNLDVLELDET